MSDSVQYQASFPAALADDAGRRFRDYVYRHLFGGWIALAFVVNVAGCIASIALSGWTGTTIAFAALVVVLTLYFGGNWVLRPGVTSRRLQRAFGGGALVTIRPEGFDLEVGQGKLSRSWARQRAIVETESYFLLVILPTIALVLPRDGMPAQGEAWIRAAMQGPMAKSPLPGA
jgi:hypothetical protein